MLVSLERLRATPGHVAYQLFLFLLKFPGRLGLLSNQAQFLSCIPMSETMDIEFNPDGLAEPVPMRLEGFITVGFSALREEQGIMIAQIIQAAMLVVKDGPISVDVFTEHFCGRCVKTDHFDSSFVATFAKSRCFLVASAFSPVTNREVENLSDTSAGFVGHPHHNLIAKAEVGLVKAADELFVQRSIINGLGNPIVFYKPEVVLRGALHPGFFYPADLRQSWSCGSCISVGKLNFSQHLTHRINQGVRMGVVFHPPHDGVKQLECRKTRTVPGLRAVRDTRS